MGKVRKGRGGRVDVPDKARKPPRTPKTSRAGQVIWCDNCQTKGAHTLIGQVAKCYSRVVSEGVDFFWVRA